MSWLDFLLFELVLDDEFRDLLLDSAFDPDLNRGSSSALSDDDSVLMSLESMARKLPFFDDSCRSCFSANRFSFSSRYY